MTALPNKEMSPVEKQQWLGPLSNIKDNSNVIKAVTYRTTKKSIISNWSELLIDPVVWTAMQRGRDNENENKQIINFSDHWDQSAMNTFTINSKRTNDGLLHLHWLQINELPHAHNI